MRGYDLFQTVPGEAEGMWGSERLFSTGRAEKAALLGKCRTISAAL